MTLLSETIMSFIESSGLVPHCLRKRLMTPNGLTPSTKQFVLTMIVEKPNACIVLIKNKFLRLGLPPYEMNRFVKAEK